MSAVDGYVRIKTKLDNKGIDKDVAELENKIKKIQTDNSNKSKEENELQGEIKRYDKLTQKADEYKQKIKELNQEKKNMTLQNPNLSVSTSSELEKLNSQINVIKQKYTQTTNEIDKQIPKIDKVYQKLEKVKTRQEENNAKISEYKAKIEQININKMEQGINSVGKSITKTISKVGKMTLAFLGIRTAINAVKGAMSTVAQYNPQIAADIDYIKYALAQTLLPIIQKLVNLAYTLLSYINAISQAWFGVNLFANSSAKAFKSGAKSAKEIKKSLQGFDEMNIMSDDSSSSSGGGASPSMDLSSMQGEVPAWLQWILDNKDLILSVLAGIAAGLVAFKLLNLASSLGLIENKLLGIKAIGIGVIVAGIVYTVQSLIKYLNDPSWENFGKIITGIGVILLGFGILIGNIPLIIAGVIALIVGLVISNWDKIKGILQGAVDWMYSKMDWVKENFGIFGQAIWKSMIDLVEVAIDTFEGLFSGIKNILDGIIKVFKGIFNGDMKTVLEGFKQIFKGVFDSLWSIAKAPPNLIIKGLNSLINGANKIKFNVPDWVPGLGGKTFGFNIPKIPQLRVGGIVNMPGRGVPIGGAIAGEAGREGVLPLTDAATMAQLGQEIGKWISINMTNITKLDSKIISRQTTKHKNQLAFETNGGVH